MLFAHAESTRCGDMLFISQTTCDCKRVLERCCWTSRRRVVGGALGRCARGCVCCVVGVPVSASQGPPRLPTCAGGIRGPANETMQNASMSAAQGPLTGRGVWCVALGSGACGALHKWRRERADCRAGQRRCHERTHSPTARSPTFRSPIPIPVGAKHSWPGVPGQGALFVVCCRRQNGRLSAMTVPSAP